MKAQQQPQMGQVVCIKCVAVGHSTNGTYVNGARIQKDVPMSFPAGTVLQLADGSNEIKLG